MMVAQSDTGTVGAEVSRSEQAAVEPTRADASVTESSEVTTAFTITCLRSGETVFASPAFETVTGYPVSAVMGEAGLIARLLHPDHRQSTAAYVLGFWAGRAGAHEARMIRRDGQVRWVRLACTPLPAEDAADGAVRMVTCIEDITARVVAVETARAGELAARAAHEAKSALISRMSHELRTPLNAVIGFGQLLERRLTDDDDLSSVQYILSSGRHLLTMIDAVLETSRIGAGALPLTVEPVDAASLVDEVVNLVQPLADRAGIGIAVEGGPGGLRILGDRSRLVQVLRNLVTDTLKDHRPGGHIWVSWSALGGASVTIRDDRLSTPPRAAAPVTPFDQVGAETTVAQGSGVELAVTRALIELMSGSLSFASAPGSGSSCTVSLPSAPDRNTPGTGPAPAIGSGPATARAAPADGSAASPTPTPTPPPGPESGSLTLLYIEDNQPNVRVVASLLRLRPEWKLVHAGLGGLGLELARSRRPDMVLLDLHLPDCFGLSILEALKADPATADIPVVILSADASLTQVDRLLLAGAAQYLTKPLDVREVLLLLDGITADQSTRTVDA